MSKIRVMIVDDHTLVREGIRGLLSGRDDMEVVGEAADGREAASLLESPQRPIVLLRKSLSPLSLLPWRRGPPPSG